MQSSLRSSFFKISSFSSSSHRLYSSSSSVNHYDVLGLTAEASSDEIKNAYYRLSKLNHPDSTSKDEDKVKKFHAVTEAYRILGTPKLRRKYDMGSLGLETSLAEVHKITHKFDNQSFYKNRSALQRKYGQNSSFDDYTRRSRASEFRYHQIYTKNKGMQSTHNDHHRQNAATRQFLNKTVIVSLVIILAGYQIMK